MTDLIKTHIAENEIREASVFKMCYTSLSKGKTAVTVKTFELDGILFDE